MQSSPVIDFAFQIHKFGTSLPLANDQNHPRTAHKQRDCPTCPDCPTNRSTCLSSPSPPRKFCASCAHKCGACEPAALGRCVYCCNNAALPRRGSGELGKHRRCQARQLVGWSSSSTGEAVPAGEGIWAKLLHRVFKDSSWQTWKLSKEMRRRRV